jgi:putative DNA primase/helicase
MAGPLSDGGRPGHALVILDLDAPEAVRLADDFLPATGMAEGRSGKPRSHRYYLVPVATIPDWAESRAPQAAKAARKQTGHPGPFVKSFRDRDGKEVIRLVGTGGQVVCPPSRWTSADGTRTEVREWDGGEPGEPAVVPFADLWGAVCRLAEACGAEVPRVGPRAAHRPTVEERAVAYLERVPGAVSGQGGHDRTFAAACALVQGFDLDPGTALSLLLRHYNPRCVPPWSEDDLRHKVEDADRAASDKPRGYLRDADGGTGTPGTPPPDPPAGAAGAYPRPRSGEQWDDPHRLARLFLDEHRTESGEPTLVQWRDEFHTWGGAAWLPVPDSDLDARLARHCRAVFEADYPVRVEREKADRPPTIYKVTSAVRCNVRLNLSGLANHPDAGDDPPFWLGGGDGRPEPAAVVAAPSGLFTLRDIAAGRGPFLDPTPTFFTANALPFPVPRSAPPPQMWLRCLGEWFDGDEASIAGLQEWFGLMLTADTSAHRILMLVGPPRSGKGTVLHVLTALVGAGNVASTSFAALGENFGLEGLLGRRVAVIPDGRLSGRTDVAAVVERLLSISGEDPQSVNRKNRRRVTTTLRVRFVLATNEIPRLPDASGALASRFHILQTPNSWLGREDRDLRQKLTAELPGILLWAAAGWVRLRDNGMTFTPNNAAAQYHRELADLSSPVKAFVRECCLVGPEHEVEIPELYAAWKGWNEDRNREVAPENIFGRDLRSALPHLRVVNRRGWDGKRTRHYAGIGLKARSEWGDEDQVERTGTRSTPTHAAREGEVDLAHRSGGCASPERVPVRSSTPPDRRADLAGWVRSRLAGGPVPVQTLRTEAAREGFDADLLGEVGAESRVDEFDAPDGRVYWRLQETPVGNGVHP